MLVLKKIVRTLDRLIDTVLFFIFLLFFLIGLYALYDSCMVYLEANDTSLLKYKPGYGSGEEVEKEIGEDMVAWLTLDDTNVDYPVMQGEDNTEYLNKNPFGEYALAGSIFLDSRNSPDFSDMYSLVYGHHMEHGMMFGALDEFLNEEYFKTHQTGTLTVVEGKKETDYRIRIFAVLEAEATEPAIFAPTEVSKAETLQFVKTRAKYIDPEAETGGDIQLLAMSTCKYPDTVERTIVFATIEPEADSEAADTEPPAGKRLSAAGV